LDPASPFLTAAELWQKFAPFEVFGDHVVVPGGRLAYRVSVDPALLGALLGARASSAPPLDLEVAGWLLRAGLGLVHDPAVEAVYVVGEDAVVVARTGASGGPEAVQAAARLAGRYGSVASVLAGRPVGAYAAVFEFPDASVLARAVGFFQEASEEATPRRSAAWVGAQRIGREEPFHPSMLDTLEEQTSLLESAGVNLHDLPAWWWRGAAAARVGEGAELLDPPPPATELLARAAG